MRADAPIQNRSTCLDLRSGSRWRLGARLIAVLFLLGLMGGAPAAAQSGGHPWQTLMSAAAEANVSDDFVTAEALLNAALEVAQQVDPQGPRPVLSRLMLQLIYADLGKMEMSER